MDNDGVIQLKGRGLCSLFFSILPVAVVVLKRRIFDWKVLMFLFCVLILFGFLFMYIRDSCACQMEITLVKALQKQLKNSQHLVNHMEKRNQLIELQQKKLIKVLKGATKLLEDGEEESKFHWTSSERPSPMSAPCDDEL